MSEETTATIAREGTVWRKRAGGGNQRPRDAVKDEAAAAGGRRRDEGKDEAASW